MGRRPDVARPEPRAFADELRALAPHADYPVDGQVEIREWFYDHGFRRRDGTPLSWGQLKDMQRRCGQPWGWHTPAIGVHQGRPFSTHLLLLRWAMVQAEKLGPPWSCHWEPAPRTQRLRRQRRPGA